MACQRAESLNTNKANDGNEEYDDWLDWSAERIGDLLKECIRLHIEMDESKESASKAMKYLRDFRDWFNGDGLSSQEFAEIDEFLRERGE